MTKTIKQTDNDSCVSCVCAMATGTTVEEFRKFVTNHWEKVGKPYRMRPPYSDLDAYRYLLHHGYILGIGYQSEEKNFIKGLSIDSKLSIEFNIKDYPAYIVVKSMRVKDKTHAIYWDGYQVYDPNPELEDQLTIDEYEIESWFPIIRVFEK